MSLVDNFVRYDRPKRKFGVVFILYICKRKNWGYSFTETILTKIINVFQMKSRKEVLIKITHEYSDTLHHWVTVKHYMCW